MPDFITVNGITFHCAFAGPRDGRPLVLLNTLGSELRIWDDMLAPLTDRHRIVRFDQRGQGLTDSPPGPYTIDDHVADLAGLLDHLGLEKVALAGISVGGMIAMGFAAAHAQRVQALILCDTAAKLGTAAYWNQRIEAIQQNGMAAMADTILSRWFAAGFAQKRPAAYRGYRNMLSRTDSGGYRATCAAIRDADLSQRLSSVRCPALVLCGAQDGATPPELVRQTADQLPDGRFRLIPDAGHTPSVENPEATVDAFIRFMEEIAYV